jgi:hypothetical protein
VTLPTPTPPPQTSTGKIGELKGIFKLQLVDQGQTNTPHPYVQQKERRSKWIPEGEDYMKKTQREKILK